MGSRGQLYHIHDRQPQFLGGIFINTGGGRSGINQSESRNGRLEGLTLLQKLGRNLLGDRYRDLNARASDCKRDLRGNVDLRAVWLAGSAGELAM